MLIQTIAALAVAGAIAAPAAAQTHPYEAQQARRRFVTIHYERQYVQPSWFDDHPLAELLGQEVNDVHLESYHYRTKDNQTLITVNEYRKRTSGLGATIYPFGSRDGATLALRGSIETLPEIHLTFTGPAPAPRYDLTGGLAYDVGAGVEMSDRAPGWSVGSHSFLIVGIGRAQTDQRSGKRYFAEGGGGIMFGPIGVDLAVKYVVMDFDLPVPHGFRMIPICVRGTLTF
jgi:hypothetical protein